MSKRDFKLYRDGQYWVIELLERRGGKLVFVRGIAYVKIVDAKAAGLVWQMYGMQPPVRVKRYGPLLDQRGPFLSAA